MYKGKDIRNFLSNRSDKPLFHQKTRIPKTPGKASVLGYLEQQIKETAMNPPTCGAKVSTMRVVYSEQKQKQVICPGRSRHGVQLEVG